MSRRKNDLSQRLEAVIKTLVPQQEQNPDDLGPMMRAIKARAQHQRPHLDDARGSGAPARRGGAVCAARHAGHRHPRDSLTVGSIPAEWVSLEHGHEPPPRRFATATAAATPAASWVRPHSGQQAGAGYRV